MNTSDRSPLGLRLASIALYVLAALVAGLGVYGGFSFASAPAGLRAATIAFQMPIVQLLLDGLESALTFAGIVLVVISLALSVLLVACGLLLQRSVGLALRVERLEAALLVAPAEDYPSLASAAPHPS